MLLYHYFLITIVQIVRVIFRLPAVGHVSVFVFFIWFLLPILIVSSWVFESCIVWFGLALIQFTGCVVLVKKILYYAPYDACCCCFCCCCCHFADVLFLLWPYYFIEYLFRDRCNDDSSNTVLYFCVWLYCVWLTENLKFKIYTHIIRLYQKRDFLQS